MPGESVGERTQSPPIHVPGPTPPRESRWGELDVLRGMAATLMVANHVAVRLDRAAESPLVSAASFAGSFAPVLFFFLTGLGGGVQSVGQGSRGAGGHWRRAGILVLADSLLWLRPGQLVGFDFLGFIALSALVVHWLRQLRRGGAVALCLAGAVAAVRYAAAPLVRAWVAGRPGGEWVEFALGTGSPGGFSYPPAPWLTYPLVGYALGRLAATRREWLDENRSAARLAAVIAACLFATVAGGFVAAGASLFRWGSMSFAYFVASWAAAGLGLVLVLGRRAGGLQRSPLALGGVRSLAVVPLHYLLLSSCERLFGVAGTTAEYGRNVAVVLVGSFAASALVPGVAAWSARLSPAGGRVFRSMLWAAVGVALVVAASGACGPTTDTALRGGGQLSLCVLLSGSTTRRALTQDLRP